MSRQVRQTGGCVFEVLRQSLKHPFILYYFFHRSITSRRSAFLLQVPQGAAIAVRRRPACLLHIKHTKPVPMFSHHMKTHICINGDYNVVYGLLHFKKKHVAPINY